MAVLAFEWVAKGSGVYPRAAMESVVRQFGKGESDDPLRLEVALDLMAREVPARTLAGVYSMLEGARSTRPHHVLARLGVPVVTTNQD